MKTKNIYLLSIFILLLSCANNSNTFAEEDMGKPDHSKWTTLLKKYVDDQGFVNYKALSTDKEKLNAYTEDLSYNPPQDNWSNNEKLAYWINAYNAFTVKLIVENYPITSIKNLNPSLTIPTIRSIWTKEWFQIGGEDFSLDRIEHKILRKDFEEPRIHFAVNCASFSCPPLRKEAFVAAKLDQQLNEQARQFINDPTRNKIAQGKVVLSKIFKWFPGDFTEGQSLIDFLNKYSKVKIDKNADIDHMEYDWALNEVK